MANPTNPVEEALEYAASEEHVCDVKNNIGGRCPVGILAEEIKRLRASNALLEKAVETVTGRLEYAFKNLYDTSAYDAAEYAEAGVEKGGGEVKPGWGFAFTLAVGSYDGFHIKPWRICLGWIAVTFYEFDLEWVMRRLIEEHKAYAALRSTASGESK